MDWNVILTFALSSAGITLLTLLYKIAYKSGRQDCRIDYMEKRQFDNETKSIKSSNEQDDKLDKLLQGQSKLQAKLDGISNTVERHEQKLNELEKMLPKRANDTAK